MSIFHKDYNIGTDTMIKTSTFGELLNKYSKTINATFGSKFATNEKLTKNQSCSWVPGSWYALKFFFM